jgi:signal transduction histidine kinase/CheY-like chemotaxis protein
VTEPAKHVLAPFRREFALLCARDGRILWADERARTLLGAEPGAMLTAYAPVGTEGKLRALLDRAGAGPVSAWEGSVVVDGKPANVAFNGGPAGEGEGLVIVGSLVREDYGRLLVEMSDTLSEMAAMHRELERQRREIGARRDEIVALNRDLEESNRGMLALYSELEEKADSLRRNSEVKSRVVSNISHEFRTPLNSILGLARLLLARTDGPLSTEQDKQIGFILRSATELSELVNDMLDLSKMEAGKVRLHVSRFEVEHLFAALRGMSRPLQTRDDVALVVESGLGLPTLETDEGKISQILRNLVSNALKFTLRGEVRIAARQQGAQRVEFAVHDTGIGIPAGDVERVFEEFTQLENPLQAQVKGTGLGLSLSRRLADMLGGTLTAESEHGEGSTFRLVVPIVHPEVHELQQLTARSESSAELAPVLVVEDDRQTLFLYEKYLQGSGFRVVPARTIDDARRLLRSVRPSAIVLDIMLEGETTWRFLGEVKSDPQTRDIPVLVVTVTDRENKARALGADEFWMKPMDQSWLQRKLKSLAVRGRIEKILVIDDDEVSRYLVRRLLADTTYRVIEATGGEEGIRLARERLPDIILLDFVMPGMSAFEVLDELKADPATRNIPVIIHTSKDLGEEERRRLASETAAVLNKQSLSREVAIGRIREALMKAAAIGTPKA